jgi:transposase
LIAKSPHSHWKTTTFLAALRRDRIDASWMLDGPIDGESFQTYVENVLAPTLRQGDIVIMDNLGSHKGKARSPVLPRRRRQTDFPAQIRPRPEPHRTGLRKLKHVLRKAAARTVESVCAAIGELLGAFTSDGCANYFRNAGYAPT